MKLCGGLSACKCLPETAWTALEVPASSVWAVWARTLWLVDFQSFPPTLVPCGLTWPRKCSTLLQCDTSGWAHDSSWTNRSQGLFQVWWEEKRLLFLALLGKLWGSHSHEGNKSWVALGRAACSQGGPEPGNPEDSIWVSGPKHAFYSGWAFPL